MKTSMTSSLFTGFRLLFLLTGITGFIYPVMVTGIAQLIFPWEANGSFIQDQGKIVGSRLIGQYIDSPNYFWGRPSATLPYPYNAMNSSGSNLGPSNPRLLDIISDRVQTLKASSGAPDALIPIDLVTASGSGLDPEISPLAAFYQVPRVAKATHLSEISLDTLIVGMTEKKSLGLLGEPRVNVMALNQALDQLRSAHGRASSQSR